MHNMNQFYDKGITASVYISRFASLRDQVVTRLTAVWEIYQVESHSGQLCLSWQATAIYSLGHGLHTITAVPTSTQSSTIR